MTITDKTRWLICAGLGIVTLVAAILILPLFPRDAASDVSGYGGPVYAFEFAESIQDLIAVFGTADDPEQARRLVMMDRGNRWDFGFMTLYGLFGMSFGWAVSRTISGLGRGIIALAILGSLADLVETGTLLALSEEFADGGSALPGLFYLRAVVTVKFAAIGAVVGLAGLYLWHRGSALWRALGAVSLIAVLAMLPALIWPESYGGVLGLSIGMGWIIMLAYASRSALRGAIPPRR